MNNLLLTLANTPERALRLLAFALDHHGPDCRDVMHLQVDMEGTITFRELELPGPIHELRPEWRFRSIVVWLEGSAASHSGLQEAFCKQGGSIATSALSAHLLVADPVDLAGIEERWPRKLVVSRSEFEAQVIGDRLRPLRVSNGAPGSLPKALRGIWNKLRSGSVVFIIEGLDAFSVLAAFDTVTADVLLEEVGVNAASGTLLLGNRFQRCKDEANPHLLYALLGLLSRSPQNSRGTLLRQNVKELNANCPSLPELRGFTALRKLEVNLNYSYTDQDGAVQAAIADRFDMLPALNILKIVGDCNLPITSLDGLISPRLRELDAGGIGLTDIEALNGNCVLEAVNLRDNQQLGDISPLRASMATLKCLDISDTAVKELSVLAQAGEMEQLKFGSCPKLISLKGLEMLTITRENNLSITGLKNLEDLQNLPKLSSGDLSLSYLDGLASLNGLEGAADQITSLSLSSLPRLTDVDALRHLQRLESLVINECPRLSTLDVLGELPALNHVHLYDCKNLSKFPALWPVRLMSLVVASCPITQLGILPAALSGSLNLIACPKLQRLGGIEACKELKEITIRPSFTDLTALMALPDVVIHVDFCDQEPTLPEALIEALAALPQCRLRISDSHRYWGMRINNPEALSRITHLRALDLSRCDLENLLPVMGMTELELLKILPRSDLSKKLGGCTFDTPGQVAKLQLQLLGLS